jgi:putative peptidoglycan lipid II flippase
MHVAAYLLGLSALISSVLALARDRLLAHNFGAGAELDLYYAAFRIPDLLFVLFGALVSVYALIPLLSCYSDEEQHRFIDTIVLGFSLLVCLITAGAYMILPQALTKLFPEIMAVSGAELYALTVILLAQPAILGLSNIAAAITQLKSRYALYALSPILYNLGIIIGIALLYPHFGLLGIAYGVILGALMHLFVQVPDILREGFCTRTPRFSDVRGFFATLSLSLPRTAALSVSQLSFLVLLSYAGLLATGSIAVFIFAFNLHAVPLAIIGASYSVAAFPTLSAAFSGGRRDEFLRYVHAAARHILFWAIPATALLIVLRAHVVRTVLGSGAFDWTDTRLTAAAVALFSVSLVAQSISLLIVRATYAAGKTLAPLLIAGASGAVSIMLAWLFLRMFRYDETGAFIEVLLRVQDVPGSDVLALILAFVTGSLIAALLNVAYFELRFGPFLSAVSRAWWESLTAGFVGALVAYGTLTFLGDITFATTLGSVFFKGFVAGFAGIGATALSYRTLGSLEYAATTSAMRERLWRDVAPVSPAEGTGFPRL